MKTKITLLIAVLISAFSIQPSALASGYALSNDLQTAFTLFYWTNNGSGNVFSLSTNTPPGGNYVVSIPTNGPAGLGLQPTNGTMFILVSFTNMLYASNNVSSFFTNALASIKPANETVPQWQMILDSYFITGAVPTELNYQELIDTLFYYATASQNAVLQMLSLLNNQPLVVNVRPGVNTVADPGITSSNYFSLTFLFSGDNPPYTNWITQTNWQSSAVAGSAPWFNMTNYFVATSNSYTLGVQMFGTPVTSTGSNTLQFNVTTVGANGQQATLSIPGLESVYY